ncbi:MAG: hypothetical protein Fur002_25700 [Anaerolineales bacterium]
MKKNTGWILAVSLVSAMIIVSTIFSAAGTPPLTQATLTAAPARPAIPTSTPDPCSPSGIFSGVERVHALTVQFESVAQVITSNALSPASIPMIEELQRIRRAAEDQPVPACLQDLKARQVNQMNARIEIFNAALAFLNLHGESADQTALNETLAPLYAKADEAARQYENEYYRLLGVTPTPAP